MENKNLNNNNDVFLAKWMANEMADIDFEKLVSKSDFLAYKKLKDGILLYEKLEAPLANQFNKILHKIENKKQPKVKKLYFKWVISIAASFLLFFSIQHFFDDSSVINNSHFGEQKAIVLLDGSQVILNAKSAIKYNKKTWKNKRELFLDGQAFFKVKKGSNFTVQTKNGKVQVLGTQFNVNSNQDYFEVICYTGKVKITKNEISKILMPTKVFRKINGSAVEYLEVINKNPTWLKGKSNYKSVPVKYVILDLEKQFNVKINHQKINENLKFTGSFSHKNKDIAFATVFKAMNFNYTALNKTLILSEK